MLDKTFDITKAEAELSELELLIKDRQNKHKAYNVFTCSEIENCLIKNVNIDSPRRIVVKCWEDYLKINHHIGENNCNNIEIKFARSYDVKYLDKNLKIQSYKNNLKEGDIKNIDFDRIGIDLTRELSFSSDELIEYISLCKFVAENFKSNGEFIQLINNCYIELRNQNKEIEDLLSEIYSVKRDIKAFYVEQYKEEFIKEEFLAKNKVILMKYKQKDFISFLAYKAVSSTSKYYNYIAHIATISYKTEKNIVTNSYEDIYYLRLKEEASNRSTPENMLLQLANSKYDGNQVVLYTLDEWATFQELLKSETENIFADEPDEFYSERSKYYKELYHNNKS